MRQRLGIAHALLGDPEVLILDEPANGLDPEGIVWMRRLLRDFADRAGTVLLSSHLLREVEKTADQLVVINKGRVVAQGAAGDMLVDGVDLEDLFLSLLAEERPDHRRVPARLRARSDAAAAGGDRAAQERRHARRVLAPRRARCSRSSSSVLRSPSGTRRI